MQQKRQTIYYVHIHKDTATVYESEAVLAERYILLDGGRATGHETRTGYQKMKRQGFGWSEEEALRNTAERLTLQMEKAKSEYEERKRKLEAVQIVASKYGYDLNF